MRRPRPRRQPRRDDGRRVTSNPAPRLARGDFDSEARTLCSPFVPVPASRSCLEDSLHEVLFHFGNPSSSYARPGLQFSKLDTPLHSSLNPRTRTLPERKTRHREPVKQARLVARLSIHAAGQPDMFLHQQAYHLVPATKRGGLIKGIRSLSRRNSNIRRPRQAGGIHSTNAALNSAL